MNRKMIVISLLVLGIGFASLSFTREPDPKFKNLKVLDKNISKDDLELVMKSFKTALGVKCSYCHAKQAADSTKLDFASDANDKKDVARGMMRMAMKINKKFFKDEKEPAVTCFTCHQGNKEPKEAPKEVLED